MAGTPEPREGHRSLWREYRFELIWLFFALLGIFLLVERMNIRATLRSWAIRCIRLVLGGISQGERRLIDFVSHTTVSDLIGMVLVTIAVVAILWRLRWRVMHSERLAHPSCPVCGGGLYRIHRRPLDRLLAVFIPVKRYRCRNRDCGWTGLRIASSSMRSHRRERTT